MRLRSKLGAPVALIALLLMGTSGAATATPIEEAAKQIVAQLVAQDFAGPVARFDDKMREALPAERLSSVWQQIGAQAGAFRSITGARTEARGEYRIVILTCAFENLPLDIKIVFNAGDLVAGFFFSPAASAAPPGGTPDNRPPWTPPAYAQPERFAETAITVESGTWKLPGTLTMPKGTGPFPAVVLVHGSGPHDRDETIEAVKPFRDLAWGLASRGIAVLRYDKRTLLLSQQQNPSIAGLTVWGETIDDARTAVALLGHTPGVDAKRIWVLGHSLGANLGPRIAAGQSNIAGLALLAGNVRPLEDLLVEQLTFLANVDSSVSNYEKTQLEAAERLRVQVRSAALTDTSVVTVLGAPLPGSYWLDLRSYDPAKTARGLAIPIRVLQGGHDYQVGRTDFDLWQKALAGRTNARCTWYPALNHLFVASTAAPGQGEYAQPGHVDAQVIKDLAAAIGGPGAGR